VQLESAPHSLLLLLVWLPLRLLLVVVVQQRRRWDAPLLLRAAGT
jgi:hypothetical protein